MKKIFAVLFISTLCLVSCGKKDTPNNTDTSVVNPEIKNEITEEEIEVNGNEMNIEEFSGTMEELFEKGGKVTCSVKSDDLGLEGMIFIDGEKVKTSVKTNIEGNEMETNTLILDDYIYTWSDSMKSGTKFKNEDDDLEDEDENEEFEDDYEEVFNDNDIMKFNCTKGIKAGDFEVPSDINFIEFDETAIFGEGFEIPEGEMPEGFEIPEGFEMPNFE